MAKKMINIRLDEDLWYLVKLEATRREMSLQNWVEESLSLNLGKGGFVAMARQRIRAGGDVDLSRGQEKLSG